MTVSYKCSHYTGSIFRICIRSGLEIYQIQRERCSQKLNRTGPDRSVSLAFVPKAIVKVCTISFERPKAALLIIYNPSAIIGLSLLNSILKAHFLKQSFTKTCVKGTGNGKLQQFNYSRSLITNWGTVERGKIHSARVMKHFNVQSRKSIPSILSEKHNRFTFLNLVI